MNSQALTALPKDYRHAARAVVIGASAGVVDALLPIVASLPVGYPLPVVVVLHLPEDRNSLLAEVFGNRAQVPVREAADKMQLTPGTIHCAPAGYHLLLEKDLTFSLSCDAPLHYSRPSIDVLFESASDALGSSLVGVLLTGANQDGAAGLARIGIAGGLTVVQDPEQALCADMPRAALRKRAPDFILNLKDIALLISKLELAA